MQLPVELRAAQALELSLKDAAAPDNVAGWAQAVAHDEREAYPTPFVATLRAGGFFEPFIANADGQLASLTAAASTLRVVARRDLTTAIALGQCFLGSVPVWLGGTATQRARQAAGLRGGESAALALTEQAHGSDLLANQVRATREPGGWRLRGEKWLINNATLGSLLTVLARTKDEGGLGGFSLFRVDKSVLGAGEVRTLPKLRTHGIRGADISGIDFDALLPDEALLGSIGAGLDLTLKGLQVTRIGCAAFSLGSADSALRLTLDFARSRRLYGGTVWDLPQARTSLINSFVDLLIADAVALGAMRGLHVCPDQMSLASAVVKYLVPTRLEQAVRDLGVVYGARHYLREGHGHGFFQKAMRDMAVVSLFDGSTAVNLEAIALQVPRLRPTRDVNARDARLQQRFNLATELPPFDGRGLELMTLSDDVFEGLTSALDAYDGAGREVVRRLGARLLTQHQEDTQRTEPGARNRRSAAAFAMAQRAALHSAAATCLLLWQHGRAALDDFGKGGAWVAAALQRLLEPTAPLDEEPLGQRLLELHDAGAWFSLTPVATR